MAVVPTQLSFISRSWRAEGACISASLTHLTREPWTGVAMCTGFHSEALGFPRAMVSSVREVQYRSPGSAGWLHKATRKI